MHRTILAGLVAALIAAPAHAVEDDAAALEALFSNEVRHDGMRLQQTLAVDACDVVLVHTVYGEDTGRRRMAEISRFQIRHYRPVTTEGPGELGLTARAYFSNAGDRGLTRWLQALAETRMDQNRAARMRELQLRVEEGEFGSFAARNGYEMRSWLEGDPEPYYAMPLPAVALRLPPDAADEAEAAWRAYARRHCSG